MGSSIEDRTNNRSFINGPDFRIWRNEQCFLSEFLYPIDDGSADICFDEAIVTEV